MAINIPDWQPLNFDAFAIPTVLRDAIKAADDSALKKQNAATQKAYADNQDRKISADLARQKWDQERITKKEAEDQAQATAGQLAPGSLYRRAVDAGDPSAGPIGEAYGIHTTHPNAGEDLLPMADGPVAPEPDADSANVAKWLSSGAQPMSGKDVLAQTPDQYGPPSPDAGAPPDAAEPLDAQAEIKAREPAVTHPWFASVNGQRFEVKKNEATPFGDPEYDDLYNRFIAQGDDAKTAQAKVLQMRGQNMSAAGRTAAIGQKQATQLTREEQIAKYGAGNTQSNTNNLRTNATNLERTKISANAAGMGGGGDLPPVKPQVLNAWLSSFKNVETTNRIKEAIQSRENMDRVAGEVGRGQAPNAENEAMMRHTLAAISLSLGGGSARVTNQALNDIKEATGPVNAALNMAYRATHGGENDPDIVETWRKAADRLRQLGVAHAGTVLKSVNQQSGNASTWGKNPALAPYVNDGMQGLANSLGVPLESLGDLQDPTPAAPSTPQATPPRRAKQHAAPTQAAPGPSAPQQLPPTMTTPDGKVHTLQPNGRYK